MILAQISSIAAFDASRLGWSSCNVTIVSLCILTISKYPRFIGRQ